MYFRQFSVGGVEGATAFFSHGNHKDKGNAASAQKHFKAAECFVQKGTGLFGVHFFKTKPGALG